MTDTGVEHCTSFISSQFLSTLEAGAKTEAGVHRAVTISRQAGCGALVVAQKLAHYLQTHLPDNPLPWTVFDRNLMEKVLEEHDLPKYLARYLPEDRVSKIEDLVADILGTHPPAWKVAKHTAETILRLAALGNVIIIGHGCSIITAKLPDVLHVRLVAPLEKRVAHACDAYGMNEVDAHAFCGREDRGRERYLKQYFNADINDPLLYHLIINTGMVGYDDAAKVIGDAVMTFH
jgi:cytidylate kinase